MRRKPLFPPVDVKTGKHLRNKGSENRSTATANGRVEIKRRRWHIKGVASCSPLDVLLDAAEATVSLGLRELCCRENADARSFDKAADTLARVGQVRVSGELLRQVVEAEGQRALALTASEQLRPGWTSEDCRTTTPEGRELRRVYVGADAYMVSLITDVEKENRLRKVREKRQKSGKKACALGRRKKGADQRWKEVKAVTFYSEDMKHRQTSVTGGNCDALGRVMRRDAENLEFHRAEERVGNVDGGPWIIRQLDKRLDTNAVGLDFYHLGQNVHKTKKVVFGEKSPLGEKWIEALLHGVKHEGSDRMWNDLLDLRKTLRGAKRKEVDRLINYVSDRREMVRYPEFIAKGWQIGSGPMESQCRVLSDRVRGSGMRWDADNAEAVMALEAMEQSHQWPQYWKIAMLHNN